MNIRWMFFMLILSASPMLGQTIQDNYTVVSNEIEDVMTNTIESNRVMNTLENIKKAVETKDVELYLQQFSRYFSKEIVDENGNVTGQLNYYNLADALQKDRFSKYDNCVVMYSVSIIQVVFNEDKTIAVQFQTVTRYGTSGSVMKTETKEEIFNFLKDQLENRWLVNWFR